MSEWEIADASQKIQQEMDESIRCIKRQQTNNSTYVGIDLSDAGAITILVVGILGCAALLFL